MKIRVCTPSYKRADKISTFKYLPFVAAYVDPEETAAYRENKGLEVIGCARGIQGNVARVRNFILDSEFKKGAEAVVLVDDDLSGISYWEKNQKQDLKSEEFLPFIEKYSIMARDIRAFFWGVNLNQDKQVYRENTPFSTVSPILGPFSVFLKGNDLRYDERLRLKEDYDMSIQQLNRYRVILRVNKYFYVCKQSENTGGCAAQRNLAREVEQLGLLQKKWGSKIVRIDENLRSHNIKKAKKKVDYNPVIRVPIRGI